MSGVNTVLKKSGMKSALKTLVAVMALGLASQAANAQVSGGLWPGGGGGRTEDVRVVIGRGYQGFTRLNLNQLLAHALQGREVQAFVVRMNSTGGRSQATLLQDGMAVGQTVYVSSSSADHDFYVDRPNSRSLLELNMNGPVYIHSIVAKVASHGGGGWPGGGGHSRTVVLDEYIGQMFRGGNIDLDSYTGFSRYRGMKVARVVIRASTVAARGTAELYINGFSQRSAIHLSRHMQDHELTITGSARVGSDISSMDIDLRGDIDVESVRVELRP